MDQMKSAAHRLNVGSGFIGWGSKTSPSPSAYLTKLSKWYQMNLDHHSAIRLIPTKRCFRQNQIRPEKLRLQRLMPPCQTQLKQDMSQVDNHPFSLKTKSYPRVVYSIEWFYSYLAVKLQILLLMHYAVRYLRSLVHALRRNLEEPSCLSCSYLFILSFVLYAGHIPLFLCLSSVIILF